MLLVQDVLPDVCSRKLVGAQQNGLRSTNLQQLKVCATNPQAVQPTIHTTTQQGVGAQQGDGGTGECQSHKNNRNTDVWMDCPQQQSPTTTTTMPAWSLTSDEGTGTHLMFWSPLPAASASLDCSGSTIWASPISSSNETRSGGSIASGPPSSKAICTPLTGAKSRLFQTPLPWESRCRHNRLLLKCIPTPWLLAECMLSQ